MPCLVDCFVLYVSGEYHYEFYYTIKTTNYFVQSQFCNKLLHARAGERRGENDFIKFTL